MTLLMSTFASLSPPTTPTLTLLPAPTATHAVITSNLNSHYNIIPQALCWHTFEPKSTHCGKLPLPVPPLPPPPDP